MIASGGWGRPRSIPRGIGLAGSVLMVAIPAAALAAGPVDRDRWSPPAGVASPGAHVLFDDTTGPPRPGVAPGVAPAPLSRPRHAISSREPLRPQGAGFRSRTAPRTPAGTAPPDPEVLGFAQSGEVGGGAWQRDLQMGLLSTVAYFGVNVAADGSLITTDYGYQVWTSAAMSSLISTAHASSDRVVLTVKQFDTSTIAAIVGSESSRQTCIAAVINEIRNRAADGVNVDFEGYSSSIAPNFTTFIAELEYGLRTSIPQSSYLTVDTFGSSAQGGTMFDIGGLSPYVDAFDVMAYDLTTPGSSHAGPVAPMHGYPYTVTGIVDSYTAIVPSAQIILGVPYYGYKWSTTNNGPQAPASNRGSAETYSDALADFQCAEQLSLNFDPTFEEPWASWWSPSSGDPCGGNWGSWRELYYENATALGAKYDLVNTRGLSGVGIWALGYDTGHDDLWNELATKFTITHGFTLAGVVGSDSQLFIKQDAQSYQALGGALLAAPAVTAVPNGAGGMVPLLIGLGTDHNLFVRGATGSWQRLAPSAFACYDSPGATVTPAAAGGYTLTVACEGADRGLYYAQGPAGAAGLPAVGAFTSLGGVLSAGPAVAQINGTLTFFVDGSNRQLFTRTLSSFYVGQAAACVGHPAVASRGALAYIGCHGTDDQLYYSWNSGSGWNRYRSAGGVVVDGPGVALTAAGATIFVEGTNQGMFHSVLNLTTNAAGGWLADGGVIQHGAAASGLD